MEPSQGYFADRKIQLVTALKLPNHTAMRLPMVPRISPVCFPSEIERIAHNWYQPEYEIDSNVGDHLQKNERRNPQSRGMMNNDRRNRACHCITDAGVPIRRAHPAEADLRAENVELFIHNARNPSNLP